MTFLPQDSLSLSYRTTKTAVRILKVKTDMTRTLRPPKRGGADQAFKKRGDRRDLGTEVPSGVQGQRPPLFLTF